MYIANLAEHIKLYVDFVGNKIEIDNDIMKSKSSMK